MNTMQMYYTKSYSADDNQILDLSINANFRWHTLIPVAVYGIEQMNADFLRTDQAL